MTAIYDLLKYSRSYSSSDPARFSNQPTSSDSEWQHFSNPKLQLFLEDPSPDGVFRSAKVKIIWVPAGGGLQQMQQETVTVLEDIDLRSFSPVSAAPKKTQSQSLPLKVVYRDSVVGFRYLHPRVIPPGALPAFRRFQICFTDPSLATQFVDSIRHICPCKASSPATLAPVRTMAATAQSIAASTSSMLVNKAHIATDSFLAASQRAVHISTSASVNDLQTQHQNTHSPMFPANSQAIQCNVDKSGLPLCGTETTPFNKEVVPVLAAPHMTGLFHVPKNTDAPFPLSTPFAACSPQEPYKGKEQDQRNIVDHPLMPCSTATLSAGSSDPSANSGNSTQRYVTSSIENLVDAFSTTPNMTCSKRDAQNLNLNVNEAYQALAPPDCLKDISTLKELCGMSMDQLEKLVGEVIREPEFLTLLEKLDAMWKVKGFITKASKKH